MSRAAGVYCVFVGPCFYVGSTKNLGPRISDHRTRLMKGIHPNTALQAAWKDHQNFTAVVVRECDPQELRPREDALIKDSFAIGGCCNVSENAYGNSRAGEITKANWQDPRYRAKIIAANTGRIPSAETRAKMAEAKKGARNSNARRCSLDLRGETMEFETATAAAKHYGTSQQTMDLWLRGVVPWPGKGPRKPKKTSAHLIGLSGRYLS